MTGLSGGDASAPTGLDPALVGCQHLAFAAAWEVNIFSPLEAAQLGTPCVSWGRSMMGLKNGNGVARREDDVNEAEERIEPRTGRHHMKVKNTKKILELKKTQGRDKIHGTSIRGSTGADRWACIMK